MTRRLTTVLPATAVLAVSCLSAPTYHPTRLVWYEKGKNRVTGPGFTLHFAGGAGPHFPDELKLDGTDNLLGHDAAALCYDESAPGLRIYPIWRISADSAAPLVQNEITPVLSGPAVVQVQLQWSTKLPCNPRHVPHGTSTFTALPDGRILRHDTLSDPGQETIKPGDCACQTIDRFEFNASSYWTFARAFQTLYVPASDPETAPPGAAIQDMFGQEGDTACLDGMTAGGLSYQVASVWVKPVPSGPDMDLANILGTPQLLDHRVQQPLGFQSLLPWDVHGALFLGHDGCDKALQRAAEYVAPAGTLAVDGHGVARSPIDGIYGGDPGTGDPGFDVGSDTTVLTGDRTGPFAVWLRFPHDMNELRARRPDATGPWYVPQQVDSRNWIFWFRDPLVAGQKIEIGPP